MTQLTAFYGAIITRLTRIDISLSGVIDTFDTIDTNRERDHKIVDQFLLKSLTKLSHPFVVNHVNSVNSLVECLSKGCQWYVNPQTNGKMRVL